MSNSTQSELTTAENNYKLFSAQSDSDVARIAEIMAQKLGESVRSPIKDLGMVIQAFMGLGNKGVAGAVSVLGGLQSYGAPGIHPGGGSGMIGGRDVATVYAAQAVQRDLMSQYTNLTTGQALYGSRGLNQQQLGQSAAMAFQSGIQYSGGPMFTSRLVDQNYINQQRAEAESLYARTGRSDGLKRAEQLRVGGTDTTMTAGGKATMERAMDDANAVLASIRDVMGGKALENLEDTMQKLFGGDASKFGLRAARLRMMNVEAIAGNYGEGQEGAQRAAAAISASASVINSGNATVDYHAALQNERQAMSATRASLMNSGVATKFGYSLPAISHELAAQTRGEQTGAIARQETEFDYAEAALQFSGGGTAEQKKRLLQAYADREAAGSDEQKVNAARAKARAILADTGLTEDMLGSHEEVLAKLSPEAAERKARAATADQHNRNQGMMRQIFRTSEAYTTKLGLTASEAESTGMVAANMDPMKRGDLRSILEMADGPKKAEMLRAFRAENPELGKGFHDMAASGKLSGMALDALGLAPLANAQTKGFTSTSAISAQAKEEYNSMLAKRRQNDPGSVKGLEAFMEGLMGVRSFSDAEIMNKLIAEDEWLVDGKKRTSKLSMGANDQLEATAENFAGVSRILTDEQKKKLGLPTDSAAGTAWMKDSKNSVALMTELMGGGFTTDGKTAYVSGREAMKGAERRLAFQGLSNLSKFATGEDKMGILSTGNAEEDAFRAKKAIQEAMDDDSKVNALIGRSTGAEGGGKFKDLLGSGVLSKENRDRIEGNLKAALKNAETDAGNTAPESAAREKADTRVANLKELQRNFTSGLSDAAKAVGQMIVNVTGGVTVNSAPGS